MARLAGGTYPTKTYNHSELEELWVAAGGSPKIKNLMAAIAQAESSGRSWALEPKNGCTGLWQICPGGNQYYNPMTNAEEAVHKLSTQGLVAWETWTNGKYASFLVGNSNLDTSVQKSPAITRGGPKGYVPHEKEALESGALETLTPEPEIKHFLEQYKSWGEALKHIFAFLLAKESWVRILEIVAGLLLLGIAVKELFHVETPSIAPVPIPV